MAEVQTKEDTLASILERAREREGLRQHKLELKLPLQLNPPESPLVCRETPEEFNVTNASFSAQIHAFFEALHEFESKGTPVDGKQLICADGLQPNIKLIAQSFDIWPHCAHRNFHSRRLFLLANDDNDAAASLPQLQRTSVLRLTVDGNYGCDLPYANMRPVSPAVPLQLATRCPNLRKLVCPSLGERTPSAFRLRTMRHYTRPWEGPWRDARRDFGCAVDELGERLPESLVSARLWFWKPSAFYDTDDQAVPMPNLVGAEGEEDPVSRGLRELGGRLEELDVRAFVTPELFDAPAAWRRMKRLRVEFHPWCPDGTWYFAGPGDDTSGEPERGFAVTAEHYPPETHNKLDEEIDDEYIELNQAGTEEAVEYDTNMYRTEPISSKIEPLLLGFAQSLNAMPALEEAELFTWLAWIPSEEKRSAYEGDDEAPFNMDVAIFKWGVKYTPGNDGSKGVITWQVGSWRPHDKVIRAFEALGGNRGEIDTVWGPLEFLEQREPLDLSAYH